MLSSRRLVMRRGVPLRAFGALVMAALSAAHAPAQTATSFPPVRTLYVEPFGAEKQDELLRQSLVTHLRKSGAYQVVDRPADADAVLKGNGRIWVKGYFTINSRAPSTNRQPVYAGYLSAELMGKDREPLWSSLVTPSRFSWLSIVDDLAGNLTQQMLRARKDSASTGTAMGVSQKLATADLRGAGATFPAPLYRLWFASFGRQHPEVRISYSATGSETGVQMLAGKQVDFAASDVSPQEMSRADLREVKAERFAAVLGGVVPIYHLDGLTKDLNFTAEMLAGIYLGKITRWNDPAIRSANKDVDLPNAPIVVVHRSDGSGTTFVWSDFLAKTDREWKAAMGAGTRLQWPVGQGVEGSEGVASEVEKTPYAIGYVEFVYAIQHQLGFGAVRNSAGKFVRADLESLREAATTASGDTTVHATGSITNPPGNGAYPIASFTWLLLRTPFEDEAKKAALLEAVRWMLSSGQKECSALGYAPLPREVADQQLHRMETWK